MGVMNPHMQDIYESIDATYRPHLLVDRIAAAKRLVRAIDQHDTPYLFDLPVDQVHLTDEEWSELRMAASLAVSSHRAEA